VPIPSISVSDILRRFSDRGSSAIRDEMARIGRQQAQAAALWAHDAEPPSAEGGLLALQSAASLRLPIVPHTNDGYESPPSPSV
jgi:hypothetical protein